MRCPSQTSNLSRNARISSYTVTILLSGRVLDFNWITGNGKKKNEQDEGEIVVAYTIHLQDETVGGSVR